MSPVGSPSACVRQVTAHPDQGWDSIRDEPHAGEHPFHDFRRPTACLTLSSPQTNGFGAIELIGFLVELYEASQVG